MALALSAAELPGPSMGTLTASTRGAMLSEISNRSGASDAPKVMSRVTAANPFALMVSL
jgi:hypothetical protein